MEVYREKTEKRILIKTKIYETILKQARKNHISLHDQVNICLEEWIKREQDETRTNKDSSKPLPD